MSFYGTPQSPCTASTPSIALVVLIKVFCVLFGISAPLLAAEESPTTATTGSSTEDEASDLSRKAAILRSPAWRRAVFELGHWLDSQQIYTASQVASIKSDFNARVAKVSSFELQHLLDDLETKFQIMDSPEARDARAWVGRYLAAASDSKRSELLKTVPDVTRMSADELANEIEKIEAKRQQLSQQQYAFNQSRLDILASQQQSVAATQRAVATAPRRPTGTYSPYRSGGGSNGKAPFSDVHVGARSISASVWGASVSF